MFLARDLHHWFTLCALFIHIVGENKSGILWDVITYPCLRYLLLARKSTINLKAICSDISKQYILFCMSVLYIMIFYLDVYLQCHFTINWLQICWKMTHLIFFCSMVFAVMGGFFPHWAWQIMIWEGVSHLNSLQDEVLHWTIRNYQEIVMLNQVLTKVRGAIKKCIVGSFPFSFVKTI